jgi:hypothetical protein
MKLFFIGELKARAKGPRKFFFSLDFGEDLTEF